MAGAFQQKLAEKLLNGSSSSSEVDELCELISNEFLMNGVKESFEPNSYGLELELLLDAVNRGRVQGRENFVIFRIFGWCTKWSI